MKEISAGDTFSHSKYGTIRVEHIEEKLSSVDVSEVDGEAVVFGATVSETIVHFVVKDSGEMQSEEWEEFRDSVRIEFEE